MNASIQTMIDSLGQLSTQFEAQAITIEQQSKLIFDANNTIVILEAKVAALQASVLPTPPDGYSRIIPFVNKMNNWVQPSNAGDTGGSSTKPNGTFLFTPGDVGKFSAKGAYPYNNGYWYHKDFGLAGFQRFLFEFDVQYPTAADISASQAVEFELQQSSLGGYVFNMAWQCPVKSLGVWRTFDYINKKWVATSIKSTAWTPGQWVSIIAEYETDLTAKTVKHVSLTLDGTKWSANVVRPAMAKAGADYLSYAFQLDSDGNTPPHPYVVNVRNMHVVMG